MTQKKDSTNNTNSDISSDASTTVKFKQSFTKDHVKGLMILCFLSLATNALLLIGIVAQYRMHAKDHYFLASEGKFFPAQALALPNLSSNTILQWSVQAATSIYNYNFSNAKQNLIDIKEYFTDAGYTSLLDSINSSGNIQLVEDKQLIISSVTKQLPVIYLEGAFNGRYTWVIQVPLTISYRSASENTYNDVLVKMEIVRVPTDQSAKGIGITHIVIENI